MGELLEGTATGGKMRVVGLFDDDPKKIGLEYTRVIAHSRSKGMARLTMRPSLLEGEGAEAEAEAEGRMTLPLMKVRKGHDIICARRSLSFAWGFR